jgi:hypothetical protein
MGTRIRTSPAAALAPGACVLRLLRVGETTFPALVGFDVMARAFILEKAVQPRMDTDGHGFTEFLAANMIHPEGKPRK